MTLLGERVTLDPISEDPTLAPLDLMGTDRSWGIYVLEQDYTPPDLDTQEAGGADTEGDPVVASRYKNRVITTRVRIFEPEDAAAMNLVTNPSFEVDLSGWTNAGGALVERARVVTDSYRGDACMRCITGGANEGATTLPSMTAVPFRSYTASARVKAPAGEQIRIQVEERTAADVEVGNTGTTITASGGWDSISATRAFGVTGAKVRTRIFAIAPTTFLVDAVQIEEGEQATPYFDGDTPGCDWSGARHASRSTRPPPALHAAATRTNLVPNPSFEVNTTGWNGYVGRSTLATTAADAVMGTNSCAITTTVAGGGITSAAQLPTIPGLTYTASAYVKGEAGKTLRFIVQELNVSGELVGTTTTSFVTDGTWQRVSATRAFGATGTSALLFLIDAPIGMTLKIDAVMLEQAAAAGPYFDGDTPGTPLSAWTGTAGNSASVSPDPAAGNRFSRIYRDVSRKLDRIKRLKKGTIRRIPPGCKPITFDLRTARITEAPQDLMLQQKRAELAFAFTADPGGRTAEVQVGATREETTLPALIFNAEEIPGDLEAFARLLIEEKQGVGQAEAFWGAQHDTFTVGADAELFYQAESRTPKGAAAKATLAGASGAGENAILHGSLVPQYQTVLSTQAAGGGNHLAHFGSYRVLARCFRPTTNSGEVSVKLAYSVGDFVDVTENDAVTFGVDDREGRFTLVDLGLVDIERAPSGTTQRWEGQILAKSTVVSDDIYVDCFLLIPSEQSGEVKSAGIVPPSSFVAYDPGDHAAGALAGKVADIGGAWGGAGSANDFQTTSGVVASREAISDAAGVGRYEWLSETKYTGAAIRTAIHTPVGLTTLTGKAFFGSFLRYVDVNNWIMAVLTPGAESGGKLAWKVEVFKKVAGVKTAIGSVLLRNYFIGEALNNISLTFLCIGTTWALAVSDPLYGVTRELSGTDAVLGTTLKEGRLGLYHENQIAAIGEEGPPRFTPVEAWEATIDQALYPSQALEVRSDQVRRKDVTGVTWSKTGYQGEYVGVLPSGPEKAPTRFIVKATRGVDADEGIDDIAAKLFVQPRYLIAPPS